MKESFLKGHLRKRGECRKKKTLGKSIVKTGQLDIHCHEKGGGDGRKGGVWSFGREGVGG